MLPMLAAAFGVTAAAMQVSALQPLPKGLYTNLFQVPPPALLRAPEEPRIRCGMTLIP